MSWHDEIHAIVRLVPRGRVTTYGRVAAQVEGCTPRMVGWAMAAVPDGSDVPWQRVVNGRGMVSPRADGSGAERRQRWLLEREGVKFDARGRVDLARFGWNPDAAL